jgi:hypothetical protein
MSRITLALLFLLTGAFVSNAQFSIGSGDKVIQFSGYVVTFYNHRFYQSGETDKSKDRMNLDFAVFRVDGMANRHIHYTLQMNVPAVSAVDATDEFLMQATVEYRNRKDNFNISAGYDKLPFSRASMLAMRESMFMQRPEMSRGKTFNRRDLGVTLEKNFFNKRLNIYGGMYTGMGPASIIGDNDPSGKFLYVGRVEASYPARFRYMEVDANHIRVPNFSLGFGGMHSEKKTTTGTDYPFLTVDGKKQSYSLDFSAQYMGFSFFWEYVAFRITPNDRTYLYGKPTNYYLAQGLTSQVNYHIKPLKSVIGIRYDEFNPNDILTTDRIETLSFGYDFLIDGMNHCIKIHYFKRLKDPNTSKVWADDQIRVGWQYVF